jgi:hypothetical protein
VISSEAVGASQSAEEGGAEADVWASCIIGDGSFSSVRIRRNELALATVLFVLKRIDVGGGDHLVSPRSRRSRTGRR